MLDGDKGVIARRSMSHEDVGTMGSVTATEGITRDIWYTAGKFGLGVLYKDTRAQRGYDEAKEER